RCASTALLATLSLVTRRAPGWILSFTTRALTTTRRDRKRPVPSRLHLPPCRGNEATTPAPRPRPLNRPLALPVRSLGPEALPVRPGSPPAWRTAICTLVTKDCAGLRIFVPRSRDRPGRIRNSSLSSRAMTRQSDRKAAPDKG